MVCCKSSFPFCLTGQELQLAAADGFRQLGTTSIQPGPNAKRLHTVISCKSNALTACKSRDASRPELGGPGPLIIMWSIFSSVLRYDNMFSWLVFSPWEGSSSHALPPRVSSDDSSGEKKSDEEVQPTMKRPAAKGRGKGKKHRKREEDEEYDHSPLGGKAGGDDDDDEEDGLGNADDKPETGKKGVGVSKRPASKAAGSRKGRSTGKRAKMAKEPKLQIMYIIHLKNFEGSSQSLWNLTECTLHFGGSS